MTIGTSARKPTTAQLSALRWLLSNNGLSVPNMNMGGKSKEWPQTRTLRALHSRGLVDFVQSEFEWSVAVNDSGKAAIARTASSTREA